MGGYRHRDSKQEHCDRYHLCQKQRIATSREKFFFIFLGGFFDSYLRHKLYFIYFLRKFKTKNYAYLEKVLNIYRHYSVATKNPGRNRGSCGLIYEMCRRNELISLSMDSLDNARRIRHIAHFLAKP